MIREREDRRPGLREGSEGRYGGGERGYVGSVGGKGRTHEKREG